MKGLLRTLMDLVSRNIRIAIRSLHPHVTPETVFKSFERVGFEHPNNVTISDVIENPGFYDSLTLFEDFDRSVDWSDANEASQGLRALNWIFSLTDLDPDYEWREFQDRLYEIEKAASEDGFTYDQVKREISQDNVISLDELNLESFSEASGVTALIKKINRAIIAKDNEEIVGYCKSLMEAIAGAVLLTLDLSEDEVRKLQFGDRCSLAMEKLGITENNGASSGDTKIALGLNLIRKGNNKIVEGIGQLRRDDTNAGHGMPTLTHVSDAQAQLAQFSALAWCHFIVSKHKEVKCKPPF